jgi:integrase
MDAPVFPEDYANATAVHDYLTTRFGQIQPDSASPTGDWLDVYSSEIKNSCSPKWADISLLYLRKLDTALDGIENATPDLLSKYLAKIAGKRSAGTRNRTHNVFSRFFSWAVTTKRMRNNPITGLKRLQESRNASIVYCTPSERDECIEIALETGWPEWIAVPIAFYAGMRREEIANFKWEDVRFQEGNISVPKTKTKTSRVLPLNSRLEEYLRAAPENECSGFVVPSIRGVNRVRRLNVLMNKIRKLKMARILTGWGLSRVPASKSRRYKEFNGSYAKQMESKRKDVEQQLERIGWNSFRHTFGSLLAQSGVSLDKISAWMGNTPEVCRRHYAQFIPRDRRDEEIDKL